MARLGVEERRADRKIVLELNTSLEFRKFGNYGHIHSYCAMSSAFSSAVVRSKLLGVAPKSR